MITNKSLISSYVTNKFVTSDFIKNRTKPIGNKKYFDEEVQNCVDFLCDTVRGIDLEWTDTCFPLYMTSIREKIYILLNDLFSCLLKKSLSN